MNRYEKVIRVPSVTISEQTALKVGQELEDLAQERITFELGERLRQIFRTDPATARAIDGGAVDEQDFVRRNITNALLREFVAPAFAQRYTFLSARGNIQFVGSEFEFDDIPKDTDGVIARADGSHGNFIDVNLKARFNDYYDLKNENYNRVIVQGDDATWVNATHERFVQAVSPERNAVRDILYRYLTASIWVTFALLVMIEYKLVRVFRPDVDLATPLGGLGVLFVFVVLFLNLILLSQLFFGAIGFLYPYFEFEGNLSRHRTTYRKPIAAAIAGLYCAAIVGLFTLD